jgi:hypothetical protein
MLMLHLNDDYDCKLKAFKLYHKPLDIEVLISLILFLFFQENQIPYDLQLFKINLEVLIKVFQEYCEFYGLDLAH